MEQKFFSVDAGMNQWKILMRHYYT